MRLLQLIHPKTRRLLSVVHKREVFHPDGELVSLTQRDHVLQRNCAQLRVRTVLVAQAAVGLSHLLLLCHLVVPQLDAAGQRGDAVLGEGHPGVDEVVTGLQDSQPAFVKVVDVLAN